MKRMICFYALGLFITQAQGQSNKMANKVILFKNLHYVADSCICDRDKSKHEYMFVNKENYISYIQEGFGTEVLGLRHDSSWSNGILRVTPIEYVKPHIPVSVFKFLKKGNKLMLLVKAGGDSSISSVYFDFSKKQGNGKVSPFRGSDSSLEINVTLREDTVIRINDKSFKCWSFEETLITGGIKRTRRFCLDKKSLVPLSYGIFSTRVTAIFIDNGLRNDHFFVWAMMELTEEAVNTLKIWSNENDIHDQRH